MYVRAGSLLTDEACLIQALTRVGGWAREQIEFHTEPQTLYDWHGLARPEKAHIIIRRKHLSTASNDIGFVRNEQGQYESIISKFDTDYRWGPAWQTRMTDAYNEFRVVKECESLGYSYEIEEYEGVRHVVAYIYE